MFRRAELSVQCTESKGKEDNGALRGSVLVLHV